MEQVEQANDSGEWWSRRVASVISTSHRPSTTVVNSLCDDFIMVSGGQLFCPFELVGTQGMKALTQMDHCACSSPDAQVICQGDVRSRPKPADMKASGTSHQVDYVTFLFGTNSTLIVTWGNFGQYSSLQGKSLFVVLVSHFRPVLSLYCLGCSLSFVFQSFSSQSFWAPPRYSLNRPPPRPPPCLCSAQTLTQWSLLISAPPFFFPLHRKPNSLQLCGPLSSLDNSQRNQSASTLVHMQGVKGLLVGSGQLEPRGGMCGLPKDVNSDGSAQLHSNI
jgi:hypothetical protein